MKPIRIGPSFERRPKKPEQRELRIQSGDNPLRVFYAFDPRRLAILLIRGEQPRDGDWMDIEQAGSLAVSLEKRMNSYAVQFEIAGPTAMWTRPDTGDAPVSYPAPTFSAAKGMFESICWLKSTNVVPVKVEICTPLVFHTYSTNYGGPLRKSKIMKNGSSYQLLATVLINVSYRLYAEVVTVDSGMPKLSEHAKPSLTLSRNGAHAYRDMFERRLTCGQWHSVPCLGWKEFTPSYVGPFRDETEVCQINIVLPSMLYSVFSEPKFGTYRPTFRQNVAIDNGVLIYA